MPSIKFYGPHEVSPKRHSNGAAGFDLVSAYRHDIAPGETKVIQTGVKVAIPEGYVGLIRDRSSLHKKGLMTLAGVIDSDYRGFIGVVVYYMWSNGSNYAHIEPGNRLAQLVVVPCLTEHIYVENEEDLVETERGDKGFGSTGV